MSGGGLVLSQGGVKRSPTRPPPNHAPPPDQTLILSLNHGGEVDCTSDHTCRPNKVS